jgi:hypothetical protein
VALLTSPDIGVPVDAVDNSGNTALHAAVAPYFSEPVLGGASCDHQGGNTAYTGDGINRNPDWLYGACSLFASGWDEGLCFVALSYPLLDLFIGCGCDRRAWFVRVLLKAEVRALQVLRVQYSSVCAQGRF